MSSVISPIITGIFTVIAAIAGSVATLLYQEYRNRTDLTKLTYGKEVAIQVSDGSYLVVDPNKNGTLFGGSENCTAWGIFILVKADSSSNKPTNIINVGDKVRIKAQGTGKWKYVSVQLKEDNQLVARSNKLEPDQIFSICATKQTGPGALNYRSTFALEASNTKKLTYNSSLDKKGTKRLIVIHDHVFSKETFVFVNPHEKSDD